MISQELMLGDWVMLNPDLKGYYSFAGRPCMVIGLHDDDGAIKIEYDNGKYFWTDAEDDVLPIPLTLEILEKNGFKEYNGYGYASNKGYCFEGFYINYDFTTRIANIDCKFNYVHELQNALKLCGIGKIIEP